ncbi:MAG TPA: hypothetical protein GXX37_14830 [Clostridiaceae bacterium]|nr:hypothetical protein [Clostridiaceae bacterium]
MNKIFKKGVTIFILCCTIVFMLGACMTQRNNTVPERQNNQNNLTQRQDTQLQGFENQNDRDLTPQTGQTRNPLILNRLNNNDRNALDTTPRTTQRQNGILNNDANNNINNNQTGLVGQMNADTEKSKQIKAQLEKMSGVDDVSVVVLGNTALVGCDIDNDNRTGNTDNLKNKIVQQVKNMDNSITNCVVTDKPEILERIKALGEDITNGKPGNEITEEFNRIINMINR